MQSPPFYSRYGFERTGDSEAPLTIESYPEICANGALRATVIASAVDLVGSLFTRDVAGTDATFTSDLSIRIPSPGTPARLVASGQKIRAGRRLVTTEVDLRCEGERYAIGQTTFSRLPRPSEQPVPDLAALSLPEVLPSFPLDRPLDEEVGIETIDGSRGCIELPLRDALRNPEGVLQGALVALIVECAALAAATGVVGETPRISSLDLRYLATASVGPIRSEVVWIGESRLGQLRIALRDAGRDDRVTTLALVQVVGS